MGQSRQKHVYCSSCELRTSPGSRTFRWCEPQGPDCSDDATTFHDARLQVNKIHIAQIFTRLPHCAVNFHSERHAPSRASAAIPRPGSFNPAAQPRGPTGSGKFATFRAGGDRPLAFSLEHRTTRPTRKRSEAESPHLGGMRPGTRHLNGTIQPVRSHVRPSVRRILAIDMRSGFLDGSQFPLPPTP